MTKPKPCKSCKNEFTPFRTTEKVCSVSCAISYTRETKAREFATETRKLKSKARAGDKGYQLRTAQIAFNAYIRERDKGLPCISCGGMGNKMTAGHYKSAGAYPELRFEPDNCHGQCWYNCNSNRSGNIVEYRKGLIEKIGIDRVNWLEGPHQAQHYTIDEIIEIKKKYKAKLKNLVGYPSTGNYEQGANPAKPSVSSRGN